MKLETLDPNWDDPADAEDAGGFDFGGFFGGLLKTGTDLGKSYLNSRNQPQTVTQVRPVAPEKPAWLLPIIIGGGVLVALLFAGILFSGRK